MSCFWGCFLAREMPYRWVSLGSIEKRSPLLTVNAASNRQVVGSGIVRREACRFMAGVSL
ncbi:hypothetical protein [Neptunomonas qingdaonensis]|uniref:Uncharacterized protein n=1 Tax=Neptunomonas qingdaonensis TaxID=1045558 RepID=A0A1I2MVW9_9GAMM|nr:hypothetical protein [Neptunomonas qingdaonensis]SFF95725.1 hypothetical protein SAMN05216175_102135 [Neptunomonas qingdaonensis]